MPESEKTPDPYIVRLNNVRLSYPVLFRAKASKDSPKLTFNAAFILDKTVNAADIEKMKAAILLCVANEGKGKSPGSERVCLKDGSVKEDKEGYGPGIMFVSARSSERPGVVGRKLEPITEEDGIIFAGCYVNATVRVWYQDNEHGKRVNAGLQNVQFVRKGEPFGEGRVAADEQFEALPDEHGEGNPNAKAPAKSGAAWI